MGCGHSKSKQVDTEKVSQDEVDKAELQLKITRDKLQQFQKQQERISDVELEKARELVKKGQKDRARLVLKQRKMREVYILDAEKNLTNVEAEISNLRSKQIQLDVMGSLKKANEILKHMNDLMPLEEVERIMDENQEQRDRLDEITNLVTQDMTPQISQEVEDELDRLYDELPTGEDDDAGEASEESPAAEKTKPQAAAMLA